MNIVWRFLVPLAIQAMRGMIFFVLIIRIPCWITTPFASFANGTRWCRNTSSPYPSPAQVPAL
ncbi:hypothetical protein MBAV_000642 [Candidatus Magnetobacterium bavaricum]|uniref:Uncharacterized protein n=1 Tax=Candidatus Magnetobacterium bavaricum TaxID=29290 RepID=A0A0F3GYW6_9BACT|nr:hypothetical protein MBAV_000642 [Candidatus Magnetobacterium bavaricum]